MPRINLPDGKYVEFPEDISRERAIELQNQLARDYPEMFDNYEAPVETTLIGDAFEIGKGIPRGLASTFLSAGEGIANLFDAGNDNELGNYFRDLQQSINEGTFAPSEGYEDRFSSKLGQGLGSFASFLIPGTLAAKATGAAGKAASLRATLGKQGKSVKDIEKAVGKLYRPQTYTTLGLALPVGIAEQGRNIREAEALGEDVSGFKEALAEIAGAGIGATEVFAPTRLLRSVDKATANRLGIPKRLSEAFQTGGFEGLQEMSAGILQDLVSRGLYSEKLPIGDSAFDDLTVGSATGFIGDLLVRGLVGRKTTGNAYLEEQEDGLEKAKKEYFAESRIPNFEANRNAPFADELLAEQIPEESIVDQEDKQPAPFLKDTAVRNRLVTDEQTGESIPVFDVITDEVTPEVLSTFNTFEEAQRNRIEQDEKLLNKFVGDNVKQISNITGFKNNGTINSLIYDTTHPLATTIDVKTIAMLDSRQSSLRDKQLKNREEIKAIEESLFFPETGAAQQKKLKALEKKYNQIAPVDTIRTQGRTRKNRRETNSPVEETLDRAEQAGLERKAFYSIPEAKKLLKPEDFNDVLSERATMLYQRDINSGKVFSSQLQRGRDKTDVSRNAFNKILNQKKIDTSLNSPEFKYIAKAITGEANFNKMNRGQKELLITRLAGLPIAMDRVTGSFDAKIKLPNLEPRPYSAQDINDAYDYFLNTKQAITDKAILDFTTSIKDLKLTKKFRDQFKADFYNSGRAIKQGSRFFANPSYKIDVAKRATPYYQSTEQYAQYLARQGLPAKEVTAKVAAKITDDKNPFLLPPPKTEESYDNLFQAFRERLDGYGLKDVGLRLEKFIKNSRTLGVNAQGQSVFERVDADAEYDKALNDIFIQMETVSKDANGNLLSVEQIKDKLAGIIDHETIHALRELGLITELEYNTLLEFAGNKLGKERIDQINKAYQEIPNFTQDALNEEYVAELFRLYRADPQQFKNKPKTIIEKILNFFAQTVEAITGSAFRSPLSILEDIRTGKIGRRSRGEVRNLRELSRQASEPINIRTASTDGIDVQERKFDEDIFGTPAYMRSGITLSNVAPNTKINKAIQEVYLRTKGRPTAKDFQNIYKQFGKGKTPVFRDLVDLQKDVQSALNLGIDKDWYQRWAMGISKDVGSVNMTEASAIFGITSAQTGPEKNYKDTLQTMITARKIDPVKQRAKFINALKEKNVGNKNNVRLNSIADLYKTGMMDKKLSGQKTTTYAIEINDAANNRFTPYSVIDIHMIRKLGLYPEKGPVPSTAADIPYQIGMGMMSMLTLPTYNVKGFTTTIPNSSQIQALLWGHQRQGGLTEGSYESAEASVNDLLNEIKEMQTKGLWSLDSSFQGKFLHGPRFRNQTETFDTDTRKNFSEVIFDVSPRITNELLIGKERGYLPSTPLSQNARIKFFEDGMDAITIGGGQLKAFANLGIEHQTTIAAGSWNGQWNPNFQLSAPYAAVDGQISLAKVLGDALLQDSTFIYRPTGQGKRKAGVFLSKPNNASFTKKELNDIFERVKELDPNGDRNFTLITHKNISGLSFVNDISYTRNLTNAEIKADLDFFDSAFGEGQGYNVDLYGQESELISYAGGGFRGAAEDVIRSFPTTEPSIIRATLIRDLYLPFYKVYEDFARKVGFQAPPTKPYELADSAMASPDGAVDKDEVAAILKIENDRRRAYAGTVPRFNSRASGYAKKVALELQENPAKAREKYIDIPTFKRSDTVAPQQFAEVMKKVGATTQDNTNLQEDINNTAEWNEPIKKFLTRVRANIVDKGTFQEVGIRQGVKVAPQLAELERYASTGAIQAMRWIDKSKGIFGAVLKHGTVTLDLGLTSVTDNERLALINIFGKIENLMAQDGTDYENLLKTYRIGKRSVGLTKKGKLTPFTVFKKDANEKDTKEIDLVKTQIAIQEALKIADTYPIIKEVSELYDEQNATIIQFGIDSGLLSRDPNYAEIRKALLDLKIDSAANATDEELLVLAAERNKILSEENKIDLRPTAVQWQEDADYFPFYKKMEDDSIRGPNIGSGMLGGNPLNIQLKGSKEAIDTSFMSGIFKNQMAIITAGMRNDAHRKLLRNFVISEQAFEVSAKEAQGADIFPVYINGQKRFFKVNDPELLFGMENFGIMSTGGLAKIISFPATILRETVTRDPGFVLVNMFRDTLSAAVTSGAGFTPVVGTLKGFVSDMSNLERFGVLGGYDYSADALSIEQYVKQQFRLNGIGNNGSMNPINMGIKLWDFLGQATYKSDGATRQAVYNAVYEQTGDVAEAAYQAAEIINFSRRGANPIFRIVTTAIPFLNARIQGLDVLYRSATGRYSAGTPESAITSDKAIRQQVMAGFIGRGALLMGATMLYYALVSDKDEYKERRREERDDNWLIFRGKGEEPLKLPVPFEVGLLFKTIPERIMDSGLFSRETGQTLRRGFSNTAFIDPLGFQVVKPLYEAFIDNRSQFTGSPIVPEYMEESIEPSEQYRETTNELARLLGQAFNISPLKIDYTLRGYGGTLGTYVLSLLDATLRQFTGRDYITPRIDQMPLLKRFLASPIGGGLQQQFYELRSESDKAIATINILKERGLVEKYLAYSRNNQGLLATRQQVLALDRWMTNWRDRRDAILRDKTMDADIKKDLLQQLELDRNMRLMYLPELTEQAYASQ